MIEEWDLPRPRLQYEVRDGADRFICRADFAYPKQHVLIELDSEAHHLDRITFRRDRNKQNRAAVVGWTVLRYTWWDVVEAPARVYSEIQAALSSATNTDPA